MSMIADIVRLLILFIILIAASVEDIRSGKISNIIIASAAALALLRIAAGCPVLDIVSGCLPAVLVYIAVLVIEHIRSTVMIGRGDLKLFLVLGMHFRITDMLYIILIACVIALIVFVIFIKDKKHSIPLCPMITASAVIVTVMDYLPFL